MNWHTEMGTVPEKGSNGEKEAIFPEVSADGSRSHEDVQRCERVGERVPPLNDAKELLPFGDHNPEA